MSGRVNGTVLPSGDEPLPDSAWPEVQEGRYVEHNPIALTTSDATINTRLGKFSLGADGADPMMLHFWCTKTTRDQLVALDNLAFSVIDAWARTVSVYCKKVRAARISSAPPAWSQHPAGGAGERFHVWLHLLGR